MGIKSNNSSKDEVVSDINVTPLVDVMLVLLVIFMVTAPMMLNGVNLNLPKTKKSKNVNLNGELLILSITDKQEFFIGEKKINKEKLIYSLKSMLKGVEKKTVFLRADKDLRYGVVAKTMSLLKSEGIDRISLITELER